MKTNLKIFCGISIFAIIAVANIAHAATTPVVNNKTSQFNDVLSEMGANATDSSNTELAETIRRQRALLDAQADKASAGGTSNITTANACDAGLRKCMTEKCGADFTKCASDSTTVWGNKMDACRRNTKCTGHEYTLLAPEILADRDAAIELSYYNSVVNCGNRYNNCVFGICGKSLENCLSKSAGDSAIAKCKSIADECREQDSGLAARVMGVFGDWRNIAATEAQKQEKRLYELRDLMRTQCTRFGAMFDERTLDCVYTVNFFAGTDNTLMASKKLYSGDTFQCTPDWFGVDITTYMENAQRLTRSQTSASAAAMGAGLGTAASLWTSGAVMRGIDTQNAEKQAKEKCTTAGGEWVSAGFNQGSKCDMRKPKANCEGQGYTWDDKKGCLNENNQPISSSTGASSNQVLESNFRREDARGTEPTDDQLENDPSGRICRRYYTNEWCDEYYKLYNKEKESKKAATKEQRKQRRQEILNKLSNITQKVGTGISNATQKIGDIFKPKDANTTEAQEEKTIVNCNDYTTELICNSYDDTCWWTGQECINTQPNNTKSTAPSNDKEEVRQISNEIIDSIGYSYR